MSAAAATVSVAPPRPLLPRLLPEAPRRRALPRWSASVSWGGAPPRPVGSEGVKEYVEAARGMARRRDGGPARWFSPLECGPAGTLLYLPGIDGVGFDLIRHQKRLAKMFKIWCLHIPVEDRTSFERLVEYVERTVKSESSRAPVYLVGESVGACISLAVAARNRDIDLVLILVNPGTSFHKSQLQSFSAFLELVPEPFHFSSPPLLNLLTGNFMKMLSIFIGHGTFLEEGGHALSEITKNLPPSLMILVDILPKEALVWKFKMMRTGSRFVNSRIHAVKAQTLVLASGNDELLPSREEAERLQGMLENCRIRHFRYNRHKILLEDGFDIVTTIKGAGYYRRSRQADFITDYVPPTPDELEKIIDGIRERSTGCFGGSSLNL